jgi:hypothetical protein
MRHSPPGMNAGPKQIAKTHVQPFPTNQRLHPWLTVPGWFLIGLGAILLFCLIARSISMLARDSRREG